MAFTSLRSLSSNVVELAGFRSAGLLGSGLRDNVLNENDKRKSLLTPTHDAELTSIRRHLRYQASVEIDNLEWIRNEFGEAFGLSLVKQVRSILDTEFGKLRVHRYRRLFVIRHRSVEGLISSLLRIQFHAQQLELPSLNTMSKPTNVKPISLTWGVGRTTTEAEVERLRRRRHKFNR